MDEAESRLAQLGLPWQSTSGPGIENRPRRSGFYDAIATPTTKGRTASARPAGGTTERSWRSTPRGYSGERGLCRHRAVILIDLLVHLNDPTKIEDPVAYLRRCRQCQARSRGHDETLELRATAFGKYFTEFESDGDQTEPDSVASDACTNTSTSVSLSPGLSRT